MNTIAKRASTLRASLSRPSNFATTMTPRTGRITAVIRKAAMAKGIFSPAFCPRNGGKIRFPAPKNRENSIKLIRTIFFLLSFITFPPGYSFLPMARFSMKQERILLLQDSPPAAGRICDEIPYRRSAILHEVLFYLIGISYQTKKAVLIKDDFKIVVPP